MSILWRKLLHGQQAKRHLIAELSMMRHETDTHIAGGGRESSALESANGLTSSKHDEIVVMCVGMV